MRRYLGGPDVTGELGPSGGRANIGAEIAPRNGPPRPPRHFPTIDGFDLNAGPDGLDEPRLIRRSRILGNMRQVVPTEWLPELFRAESLTWDLKDEISREIGPGIRGGEDLPPLSDRQIEVVRFRYTRTVHEEAWSFRATQGRQRIYFDVEDECGLTAAPALGSSRAWPSLGKLIWILDRSVVGSVKGLYFGDLALRLENEVRKPEELRDFIQVSSFFYPAIGEWYEAAFEAWCRAIAAGADLAWPVDSISLMAVM